jgi:endonuclease/exonuclease/phosphatase family metal-dependent hydrolase
VQSGTRQDDQGKLAWDHLRSRYGLEPLVDKPTPQTQAGFGLGTERHVDLGRSPSSDADMMDVLRHAIRAVAGATALLVAGCSAVPNGTDVLRVVTYNIRHGEGMDRVVDLERTAGVLRALSADVIALQEVDEGVRRSGGIDQAATLGSMLGMEHAFGSFMDYQGGRYGLALLSRLPIRSASVIRLPDGHEPRVALSVEVEGPEGRPMTFVCVHFDWVDDDTFRFAQATATAQHLEALAMPYVVLGDFNDQPGSRSLQLFSRGTRAAWDEPTPTFPADAPRIPIDHVFAGPSSAWDVVDAAVVDEDVASDHRPILVRLRAVQR